ncbi:MAG: hypothetical protein ACSLE7_11820 [Mycobacterium sp.]
MSLDEFVAELSAHADRSGLPALRPIIDRLTCPVQVRTSGRPGVGRRTVTAALCDAGLAMVGPAVTGHPAEVHVLVMAEAAKPEDCRAAAGADRPLVLVLNKADLLGGAARDRASRISRLIGAPTIPVAALLAVAALDDDLIAALRALATDPADLRSTDAFCAGAHPVGTETRRKLLATLDLTGIAAVTRAIGAGRVAERAAMTALLHRLSNIDEVVTAVYAAAAPLRYQRLRGAMIRLRALAARTADHRLAGLLAGDHGVLAAMDAAADVLRAAGLEADHAEPLRRAVRAQRYGRGPVNALHRSCSADIARGALRLAAGHGQLP